MKFITASALKLFTPAFILLCAACSSDISQKEPATAEPKILTPKVAPVQAPAVIPDYDFKRALRNCVGYICTPLPMEEMSVEDYNPNLIDGLGLSKDDTLSQARDKLDTFYNGLVSSGLSNTTNPELALLHAQLSPGRHQGWHEYEIYIRTQGMTNSANVHDWGARIRCAPVTEAAPWQTTPCN